MARLCRRRAGYALGFETADLEAAFCRSKGKPIPQHSTFPVTYDDAELTQIAPVSPAT
jgi:hypothetical protein